MSWTNDKQGWLLALGGAVVGFVATRLMERRGPLSNPGGLHMEIGGYDVYGRVSGLPHGVVDLYVVRPWSTSEDLIGRVHQTAGDLYRAYPPAKYKKIGVASTLPIHTIQDGVLKRTLHASAQYLVETYIKHYHMSKSFVAVEKKRMGREFDSAMGF